MKKLFIGCCLLLTACNNIFYFPMKEQLMQPSEIGLEYQDIWIEDPNQPKLHAWYLPAKNPIATVIHLHGNAENISTHIASVYWLPARGISVFTLDYRAYGLSDGELSIDGLHYDIERTIRHVKKDPSINQNLILFGQSLGGSMALYTAAQQDTHGLFRLIVAESPFSGYRSIAREKLAESWITYPLQPLVPLLITDRYSPIKVVEQISPTPVLLMHGDNDNIVRIDNSEELCSKLAEKCDFWRIANGRHISAFQDSALRDRFIEYVQKKLQK